MSRLIRLAARSWPADYRAAHGSELIETAVDLSADRSSIREALSLFLNGFRARYHAATGGDRMKTWTSGARIALFMTLTSVLSQVVIAVRYGPTGTGIQDNFAQSIAIAVLLVGGIGLAIALLPARVTAALGTLAGLAAWIMFPQVPRLLLGGLMLGHLAIMWFLAWRSEPTDPRMALRMIALACSTGVVALFISNFWISNAAMLFWWTVVATVLAAWDPRMLAGMCLFWLAQMATMMPNMIHQDGLGTHAYFLAIIAGVIAIGLIRVHRVIGAPAT